VSPTEYQNRSPSSLEPPYERSCTTSGHPGLQMGVPSLPSPNMPSATREFSFRPVVSPPVPQLKSSVRHSVMHFYRISPAEMSISYLGNKQLQKCRWASPIRNYPASENLLACLHLGREPGNMALTLLTIPGPLNSSQDFRCEEVATIGLGKFVCHNASNIISR